jgi:hypothetical protein
VIGFKFPDPYIQGYDREYCSRVMQHNPGVMLAIKKSSFSIDTEVNEFPGAIKLKQILRGRLPKKGECG